MADDEGPKPAPGAGGRGRRRAPAPTLDPDTRLEAATELEGLRREIDAVDVRIVALLNERARLGLAVGHAKQAAGWSGVRDPRREREVLLRVSMANHGPLPQKDLLAIYKRLIAAVRGLEDDQRIRRAAEAALSAPSEPEGDAPS